MTWQEIGAKEKKRITSDWASQFPEFTPVKPMRLLRRWGPLVCGVCLEARLDSYRPGFHIHNLLRPFPTISLACHTELDRYLHFEWHEGAFRECARLLRDRMEPFLASTLAFDSLRRFCRSKLEEPRHHFQISIAEDLVLLATWSRQKDWQEDYQFADAHFRGLPTQVQSQLGGHHTWKISLDRILTDPASFDHSLSGELAKHKIEGIPVGGFV